MKKIAILFLLLCIAAVSFSQQSKMSPYTRHFINQKKQTSQSASIQKRFMIREVGKIEYINSYIYLKKDLTNGWYVEGFWNDTVPNEVWWS